MKISEKVIRFADGEMNEAEREQFEKDLNKSSQLKEELSLYKNLISETKTAQNISVDENYYASVIPKFRIRQAKKEKSRLLPGIALGVTLAAALFLFVITNKNEPSETEIPVQDFTVEDVDSILNYYSHDFTEIDSVIMYDQDISSQVNDMLLNELNITEDDEAFYSYSSTAGYNQNFENLSNEEAEIVYNEILNKRFF